MSFDSGFLKFARSTEARELMKKPNAFTLLALIALRARRNDGFNVDGLRIGEAMIGDYDACGLTRQEHRTALDLLKTRGFVTTTATSTGTVAKLINARVWDINAGESTSTSTNEQPTSNQQATTNKKGKNERSIPPNPQGGEPGKAGRKGGNIDRLPSTPEALWVATLFSRRLTTRWDRKEYEAFRRHFEELRDPENRRIIEGYYRHERAKGDGGFHRRDLGTFLDHFVQELDRARNWAAQQSAGSGASEAKRQDDPGWREFLEEKGRKYREQWKVERTEPEIVNFFKAHSSRPQAATAA